MAQLNLSVGSPTSSTYDLTALGTADWIVYPSATAVRKATGGSVIGVAHIGSFSDSVATDGNVTSTWSDGAGTASGSTHSLIFSGNGQGIGYSVTVPANTQQRTLYVISGCYGANVTVTATLSDGSAAQQTGTITWGGGGGVQTVTTITYSAASVGQTLTVSLVQGSTGSYSNTSLQSAALTAPAAAVVPGAASLALAGYAPSVVRGVTTSITPGAGAVGIAGYAPSVTQGMTTSVSPAPAAIGVTGYAPSVTQTAAQSVSPAPGGLAITGYAPTVVRGASLALSPGAAQLGVTGYAPTISQANNVTPHYHDATIMQLSAVRAVASLGPDRLQQTVDLV